MIDNLFATGRIYLVRRPIRASLGPDTIFDRLTAGDFDIDMSNQEETYVIFTNKRRTMLLIFHMDEHGYDLTKRKLFARYSFRILLQEDALAEPLTREALQRLVYYGTTEEDFESVKRENLELKLRIQSLESQQQSAHAV